MSVNFPAINLRENSTRLTIAILVAAALVGLVIALVAIDFMES
jgi:hypothetical protein